MVNLDDVKQAAQVTADKSGKPVVQIPLELWQEWLGQGQKPQHERIREALADWDEETSNLSYDVPQKRDSKIARRSVDNKRRYAKNLQC